MTLKENIIKKVEIGYGFNIIIISINYSILKKYWNFIVENIEYRK